MTSDPISPSALQRSDSTSDRPSAWSLYDTLIAGVPDDIVVTDYCLGTHWSYVEAECGMGVAWTCPGGAKRTEKGDLRGASLRKMAELAKSWCFEEATLGIAALNAWYARPCMLDEMGATYDPPDDDRSNKSRDAFDQYRPAIEAQQGAKVVVVGHFPHVDRIAEYADLTVLERNCRDGWDTPDPACEYVIPDADFVFMTGVTLINKTAPRLLELARSAHARTVMVGPSVVMAPQLFGQGAEMLAGSVVADPEKTRFAVKNGTGQFFGSALQMCSVTRPHCE